MGRRKTQGLQSLFRKLLLSTLTVLGAGYVLNNVSMIIMFEYRLSQLSISSVQNVLEMSGILLFILASVVFIALGVLLVVGANKYYRGSFSGRVVGLGVMLGTFYLLCLGIGSLLLTSMIDLGAVLLTISPMLFMTAIATQMLGSYHSEFIGSILGLLGGILFTFAIFPTFGLQIFKLVFVEWDVPFPGPFMSFAVVEGPALVLGFSGVFVHSMLVRHKKALVPYIFYPVATLVYGVGLFVGPLILSLSFLNMLWKAPYPGETLYNIPSWVFGTVTFWSASLVMLVLGGLLLILSSFVGFFLALSTVKK